MKAQVTEAPESLTPHAVTTAPQAPVTVMQAAEEFLAFRKEADRVEKRLDGLKKFLGVELKKLPDGQLEVGSEVVYLCECESKSFDLESARESLSPANLKKLAPFIKVKETFELKAAEGLLDMTKLGKYIDVKTSTQLRVKAKKGE